jgi:hypothetical protein
MQWVLRALSSRIKLLEHEADHSPPLQCLHAVVLRHREKFTFTSHVN